MGRLGRLAPGIAAVVIALGTACGGEDGGTVPTPAGPGSLPAKLTTITVTDYRFQPLSLQVPVGTRVTWSFRGRAEHTVTGTFDGQPVDSGRVRSGSFEFEFTVPGVFEYRCAVHGESMAGTVTVR
jgi:plastocyanin